MVAGKEREGEREGGGRDHNTPFKGTSSMT
jgi:hypothetical protein